MPITRNSALSARPESVSIAPSHGAVGRTAFALVALLVPLALALTLATPTSASAITRDQALARGQVRVDAPVPYSQSKYYAGYRTDCSGYVSMCWSTGTSWATSSFYRVSYRIATSQLKPGDALLKKGYHIRMFYGWVDTAHTEYVAYETANSTVAGTRIHSMAEDLAYGYVPTRYTKITDSPAPRNVLKNSSFDVWTKPRSGGESPVWWQSNGPRGTTLVTHRKDTHRASNSSLMLSNPSSDPAVFTELSQSVPTVVGAYYRLGVWARSGYNPRGLELKIKHLDKAGALLSETSTTGDRFGIIGSSFRSMSLASATPTGTVKTLVTVRLAGGTTTSTAGSPVSGTAVILDDFYLTRPQFAVGIRTSATSARTGTTALLTGSVMPSGAAGSPAYLYVKKPGLGWQRASTMTVVTSGSIALWKCPVTFARYMARGTYQFKTMVPTVGNYEGATSSVVSVKLQ